MSVDLLTLSIALSLASVLQTAALIGLATANRSRPGLVCWAVGMGVLAVGLSLTVLRDVTEPPLLLRAISNALIAGSMLLIYQGVLRFFGAPGYPRRLFAIWLVILAIYLGLAFTNDTPPLRLVLFSVVTAVISLIIADRLRRVTQAELRPVALFLTTVFVVNGLFFGLRAVAVISEANWLLIAPPWQTATYLMSMATTSLWTFGFILLVNQQLASEQREALYQLEQIFAAQPDAVLLSRFTDGAFVKINRSFTDLSGYSAEEVIGKDGVSLNIWRSPADRRRWAAIMQRDGACAGLEFQFRRKDGELRTCLLSSRLVTVRGIPHAISIIHDISERKQLEDTLRQSEARYRLIAEHATDVICLLCPETARFTFFSPSVTRLIGYSVAEALQKSFSDLLTPQSARYVREALDYMLRRWSGELTAAPPWTADIELVHREGHVVYAEIVTSFVRDDQDRLMVLGVARDITARRQSEIELRLARQQAETANRAKSAFLASMSHELRTPLHAVIGFAQLLSRDDNLTETQREYLAIIDRNGAHLLRLINEVLDLAKIEAGRYSFQPAPLDVRRILADLAAMFQSRVAARRVELAVSCADEVPAIVISDESKLRQILINLLENAVKFTEAGRITLRCAVTPAQRLAFSVEDTGIGIDPADQPHLFKPFFQVAHKSIDVASGGVGLGLSISFEFARLIGGELTVYSEGRGRGARFVLTVPLQVAVGVRLSAPELDRPARAVRLRDGQPAYRMLVVDDQPANGLLLSTLLGRLGFAVRSVADGQSALEEWRVWQPHMIWLDMHVPLIDGVAVAREIRSACLRDPDLLRPFVIALSANVFAETPDSVINAGCDAYLVKPFREQDVVRIIEEYLNAQFEYAELVVAAQSLTTAGRNALQTEWRDALRQAARDANIRRLRKLVAAIEAEHPDQARQLRQWVETFDYQAILRWLDAPALVALGDQAGGGGDERRG